jgi:hypothetical protein
MIICGVVRWDDTTCKGDKSKRKEKGERRKEKGR